MPYMSVVAKFPGAWLAFLAPREFLFCLHCLHVCRLDLWSAARREAQAEAPRWRGRRALPASGHPCHFLHPSVMASSGWSVACRITRFPLLSTGWFWWRLHSLLWLSAWQKRGGRPLRAGIEATHTILGSDLMISYKHQGDIRGRLI